MANVQIKITISEETLKRLKEDGLGKPSFGLALWAKQRAEQEAKVPLRLIHSGPTIISPAVVVTPQAPATPVTATLDASNWE